jgi:putative transposon-encoded protein
MKRIQIETKTHLEIDDIEGFVVRKVTKFGNSAKVDCPKEFIGRSVYLVITKEHQEP